MRPAFDSVALVLVLALVWVPHADSAAIFTPFVDADLQSSWPQVSLYIRPADQLVLFTTHRGANASSLCKSRVCMGSSCASPVAATGQVDCVAIEVAPTQNAVATGYSAETSNVVANTTCTATANVTCSLEATATRSAVPSSALAIGDGSVRVSMAASTDMVFVSNPAVGDSVPVAAGTLNMMPSLHPSGANDGSYYVITCRVASLAPAVYMCMGNGTCTLVADVGPILDLSLPPADYCNRFNASTSPRGLGATYDPLSRTAFMISRTQLYSNGAIIRCALESAAPTCLAVPIGATAYTFDNAAIAFHNCTNTVYIATASATSNLSYLFTCTGAQSLSPSCTNQSSPLGSLTAVPAHRIALGTSRGYAASVLGVWSFDLASCPGPTPPSPPPSPPPPAMPSPSPPPMPSRATTDSSPPPPMSIDTAIVSRKIVNENPGVVVGVAIAATAAGALVVGLLVVAVVLVAKRARGASRAVAMTPHVLSTKDQAAP